jgi:hypothetical protein
MHSFTLYLPCIFVQLINSHQQMHQNKLVLVHLLVYVNQLYKNAW